MNKMMNNRKNKNQFTGVPAGEILQALKKADPGYNGNNAEKQEFRNMPEGIAYEIAMEGTGKNVTKRFTDEQKDKYLSLQHDLLAAQGF